MADSARKKRDFTAALLQWDREVNDRPMPWKGEKDPYRIWLSEVILQQTRVEQGWDYYNRFIASFPDVHQLAKAPETKVFKHWEGLGYYSRCRNLIATARYISGDLKGKFPRTYDDILSLKGIGPYTAAAIASFAFNLPHAVVDGNVMRVLSRIFGIYDPIDSTEGKKQLTNLANELLDRDQPGLYNQAIMDFGAVICKPVPRCEDCPFRKKCHAYQHGKTNILPVKSKKIKITHRWFYYFIVKDRNRIAIRQRTGKDIWQQLYEFPMLEGGKELAPQQAYDTAVAQNIIGNKYSLLESSAVYTQQLSHQRIHCVFLQTGVTGKPGSNDWTWVDRRAMQHYAFPRVINRYLNDEGLLEGAQVPDL